MAPRRLNPFETYRELRAAGKSRLKALSIVLNSHKLQEYMLEKYHREKKEQSERAAGEVYKVLTRREVRRNWPPDPEQIKSNIAHMIGRNEGLSLMAYWGGHKPSDKTDAYDEAALHKLQETLERIKSIPGVGPTSLQLVFADSHSRHFNGIPQKRIEAYYQSFKRLAEKHGFEVLRLSGLYTGWRDAHYLSTRIGGWSDTLLGVLNLSRSDEVKEQAELMRLLSKRGEKHSLLLKEGKESPEKIRETYLKAKLFESGTLGSPDTVWLTFEDPVLEGLAPRNTFYVHSVARGISNRPWLMDYAQDKKAGKARVWKDLEAALKRRRISTRRPQETGGAGNVEESKAKAKKKKRRKGRDYPGFLFSQGDAGQSFARA